MHNDIQPASSWNTVVWLDRIASACVAISIGLTLSSYWYGVGLGWYIVVLGLLAALLWYDATRLSAITTPHSRMSLIPLGATAVVFALTLGQFYTDAVSLLWILGAAGLVYATWLRIPLGYPDIPRSALWRAATRGFGLWMVSGVVVSLVSLFFTWLVIDGENLTLEWFRGYSVFSGVMAPVSLNTTTPGVLLTGFSVAFVSVVQVFLTLLGVWAVYASVCAQWHSSSLRVKLLPWITVGVVALWWLVYGLMQSSLVQGAFVPGPILFAVGIVLVVIGMVRFGRRTSSSS